MLWLNQKVCGDYVRPCGHTTSKLTRMTKIGEYRAIFVYSVITIGCVFSLVKVLVPSLNSTFLIFYFTRIMLYKSPQTRTCRLAHTLTSGRRRRRLLRWFLLRAYVSDSHERVRATHSSMAPHRIHWLDRWFWI